jgi:phosphotransferase system HPr (HPr) family protein
VPPSSETQAALPAGVDLHARPAAQVVRTATGFAADVTLDTGERTADAKSLLAVLALGARGGSALTVRAEGDDADDAVAALAALLAGLE